MKFDTTKLTRKISSIGFKFRKHSPEILVTAGIVGTVASGVMACKATLKVNDILEDTKDQLDKIHSVCEDEKYKERYSEEDARKDTAIVYAQTGLKLVKLYAPSVILGALSIGSIVYSHRILSKRNVALAAAYAAVDKGFKEYRGRVVERFGEAIDKELKYNLKAKEVEEKSVDENGNEVVNRKLSYVMDPSDISEYAVFFEEYTKSENGKLIKNLNWKNDPEYNLIFLKQIERWANDRLKANKFLFLNEVYEMLGLPKTKAGQIVGWVYDEEHPVGDNYVDFGLYKSSQNYSDFIYGFDDAILLDFNVDGNIWDMM